MPMFDFECPKGHHTEHFLSKFTEREQCGQDGCTEVADYRPSFWYSGHVAFAQRFSPVVIHRDVNGNVRFPGSADAPVPPGFQKVELSTTAQVRQFEKEINVRDSETADKFRGSRQAFLDGQLKANREAVAAIRAGGAWEGTDEAGNIVIRHGMSERGQKIYDALRRASELKQSQGPKATRPEFFVEAFTQDASNREDHRDSRTDWNRVRK